MFLGGFDLDAAQAVAGGDDVERYQVLDQLALLVDKSLVVAENTSGRTRYRLLETVRQYALEKLGESGEADAVRVAPPRPLHGDGRRCSTRRPHRPSSSGSSRPKSRSTTCAPHSAGAAKTPTSSRRWQLASSLQPLWLTRGRIREGLAWFDAALTDRHATTSMWRPRCARGRSPTRPCSTLGSMAPDSMDQAQRALAIAREVDDPALLARALTACGACRRLQRRRRGGPAVLRRGDRPRPRHWRQVAVEPDPGLAGQCGGHAQVTRSRRARPPKKDATSPRRSVTGPAHGNVAACLGSAQLCRAIWPELSRNSATWWPRREAAHDDLVIAGRPDRPGHYALAYRGDVERGARRGRRSASRPAAISASTFLGLGYGS